MSEENKAIIIKRFKSLLWRLGMMIGAVLVNFVANNIGLFNLPVWAVGFAGLILAELTKYFNRNAK